MKTHELKTWPEFFEQLGDEGKNYEIRINDRDYQKGDTVVLKCWNPVTKKFVGPYFTALITYVTPLEEVPGLSQEIPPGVVVFGLKFISNQIN